MNIMAVSVDFVEYDTDRIAIRIHLINIKDGITLLHAISLTRFALPPKAYFFTEGRHRIRASDMLQEATVFFLSSETTCRCKETSSKGTIVPLLDSAKLPAELRQCILQFLIPPAHMLIC